MTHTEQILVYKYVAVDDGFGGWLPGTPTLEANAPTWATIQQVSGDDLTLSERFATNMQFDVTCNWRDDYTWQRDCFIVSRFGNLDIDGITEQVRKRTMKLRALRIEGVDEQGSGSSTPVGGLTTLYYTVPADSATLNISAIFGKFVYLVFRDGVEKKKVPANPQVNEVQIVDDVLSLVDGDIFWAGERITILYA